MVGPDPDKSFTLILSSPLAAPEYFFSASKPTATSNCSKVIFLSDLLKVKTKIDSGVNGIITKCYFEYGYMCMYVLVYGIYHYNTVTAKSILDLMPKFL